MQLIPSESVKEGQYIARDVRDGHGRILLSKGQRLTTSLISRLFKFRVESVYIRDGFSENEPELVRTEIKQKCQELLGNSFNNITQEMGAKRLALNPDAIRRATDALLSSLLSVRNPIVTILDISSSSDRLMQHSVNAAILAITLGIDLKLPDNMLTHLASAMMFHDIGTAFLPESITQNPAPLTLEERNEFRKHAQIGFEYLVRTEAVSSIAANIVLRHHEAMNGSGYPHGITEDKLSLLQRIACVVEAYDSLTSARPGVPAVMPDAALTYIISNTGKIFAREAVIALCHRVALYPTGTAVIFNTGEMGVVVGTVPASPTRPSVLIQLDHRGKKLTAPAVIHLTKDFGRSVVGSAQNIPLLVENRQQPVAPRGVNLAQANIC